MRRTTRLRRRGIVRKRRGSKRRGIKRIRRGLGWGGQGREDEE